MRYLTLAEALVIAEAVTGIGHLILANSAGVGLLLTIFCLLNGSDLHVDPDDAVEQMLGVASGEIDEAAMAIWLSDRLSRAD